jgi:hypothetical protein
MSTETSSTLSSMAQQLDVVAGQILDYALLLAAIGTVTMALLELIKALARWRKHFHRRQIEKWLATAAARNAPHEQLLLLAAGGSENADALYDQPTGKLMGQIQAAANVALDFPERYKSFYDFITTAPRGDDGGRDQRLWREFSTARMSGRPRRASAADDAEARAATQARARLGNLVARKLDALQNAVEYKWARYNQAVSIVGGAALLAVIFLRAKPDVSVDLMVLLSITGGMVAPFAKDVVSALSGLRTRRT